MHSVFERIARLMAILGGLVLTVLVVLVCVSVLGRGLNTFGHSGALGALSQSFADWLVATGVGPVNGDFELVESGIAFAIFAFFPICQLYSGHATVDIFTSSLPRRINRLLAAFWEIVLALILLLVAWRLFVGLEDKRAYGETTFILQFPVWWAFGASFIASAVASLIAVYCAAARVAEAATGRSILPAPDGATH